MPSASSPENSVIGIDLGGTNVRACVYSESGKSLGEKCSEPSRAQSGNEAIFSSICDAVKKAIQSSGTSPKLIGMAIPGIVDNGNGLIKWAPNFGQTVDGVFRFWENIDVRSPLEKSLNIPVQLGNDANLAALGEYRFGIGRNQATCLVMFTMGTGIGGGIVMNSQAVGGQAQGSLLLLGGNQGGAELGHTIIHKDGLNSTSGAYGSVEAYCQRDAIIRRAQNKLLRGRKSSMNDAVSGDLGKLTPLIISQAATSGDAVALEVWSEIGEFLGIAVGNAINTFAPEVVAIGGQIAKVGEPLMGAVRKSAQAVAIPSLFEYATIEQAQQIEDAGLLGGAALALEYLKWN